jgi:DNA-binding NarL/FixJ family response regulator
MATGLRSIRAAKDMFEALVYTEDRSLEIRCSQAFAELPLDWTMLREADAASKIVAARQVDFVILDVDTPEGCATLANLTAGDADLPSVVLAVSSAPVNAALLQLCYRAQVYYPVRPSDLADGIRQAMPFAATISARRAKQMPVAKFQEPSCAADRPVFLEAAIDVGALLAKTSRFGSWTALHARDMFRMRHSLSVVAQEWVASGIASAGMLWYIQEVTSDFHGMSFIEPPSSGPTYLIALSLLLWLCAKSRRLRTTPVAIAR